MIGLMPPFVLLENRLRAGAAARLYRTPVRVVSCQTPDDVEAALVQLEAALDEGLHAAGFLTYEAGAGLEPRLRAPGATQDPVAWFGLFEHCETISQDQLDAWFGEMAPPPPVTGLSPHHSLDDHLRRVETIKTLIAAGDVYQVNLTYPIDFQYAGEPLALYAALRSRQPVANGGLIVLDDRSILSVSPELFVSRQGDQLTTRPMKGTASRGGDAVTDEAAVSALLSDPKQRAENLMITDLLRNDLSRVCMPGSVQTPALFAVETYPGFHALTSTVTGRLRPNIRLVDIFRALFPCGSIVGAPKIRAAEIIAELESRPRGVYTGAIGALGPNGDLDFNVAIRTAVIAADGRGHYGVGGGIVADSDPVAEYAETRLKARVLTDLVQDYQLIETLRWSATAGLVRLESHVARLAASAVRLRFKLDEADLLARLARSAAGWDGGPDQRVRLLLHRCGRLEITSATFEAEPRQTLRVAIFNGRLDAADLFLGHKTTRRELHEKAASAAAVAGFDEMILLNQQGRVADGARNTVFLDTGQGLLTPPITEGALPGVLRRTLLDDGQAREARIEPGDLMRLPVLIGNSLRGLRKGRLAGMPYAGR